MHPAPPAWRHDVFAARAPRLAARGRIKDAVRRHLIESGFAEVDLPGLQVSPEFGCKKLLAAGLTALFSLAPVFRNRERGRLHHPEFTMLEWYRAGAPLDAVVADCAAFLRVAAEAVGTASFSHRGLFADPFAPPELLPVVEAFRRHAGLDLAAMMPGAPDAFARLAQAVRARGLRVSGDDTWSDLFSKVLSALVEPELGRGRATVLTRYPASEAALARLCPEDERFAQRFELYCCGVELANGFAELTDAGEQRRRFAVAEAERQRIYGERYPLDEEFLAALESMPESCGVALGFDRLVMLATGAAAIEDVLWLPVAEPPAPAA